MFDKKGIPQGMTQPAQGQQNPPPGQPGQIMVTQEQMILIQQLVSSPAFINLRQQAQTNPENIPALLQMLQQNYPSLFALFNQNPHLLIAILAGDFNADQIQNQDFGDVDPEGADEYDDNPPQAEVLTPADQQAIQSVN